MIPHDTSRHRAAPRDTVLAPLIPSHPIPASKPGEHGGEVPRHCGVAVPSMGELLQWRVMVGVGDEVRVRMMVRAEDRVGVKG